MLSLKHAGTDVHREWLLVRDMPEDEILRIRFMEDEEDGGEHDISGERNV